MSGSTDGQTPRRRLDPRLFPTIGIGVLQYGALSASRLVVPLLALQQGAPKWVVGLMAGLFAIVPALTTVHAGRWMDRTGLVLPVVLTGSMGVSATAFAALFPSVLSMFIVAPMIGAATVIAHVAVTRAVGALDDDSKRTRNLGYLAACYSVLQLLSPLLAGAVFDAFGARIAFLAILLLPALSLLIVATGRHALVVANDPLEEPAERLVATDLLRMPDLRRWLIANGIFAAALALFPFVAALHAVSLGFSGTAASGILASASLGAVAMRMALVLLPSRIAPRFLLGGALVATAIAYATLPLFSDWLLLAGVGFLLGMGVGAGQPIAMSLLYVASPKGRINESLGLGMAIASLKQFLWPILLGLVASSFGIGPMVWVIAIMLLLAAVYMSKP